MEFPKTIETAIKEWKDENKENRAVIVIGVERTNVEKHSCDLEKCGWVIGNRTILRDTIYHIITDKNKKNDQTFKEIFASAIRRAQLDAMCDSLSKQAEKVEKMMKELGIDIEDDDDEETATNDAETAGKEDSHE